MTRLLLAALLVTASEGGVAHAQSRPMPSYQDDEKWAAPTASDDNANSRDARRDEGYPSNYGDPPTRRPSRQSGDSGYNVAPPPFDGEDAAHRADRQRTAELNHRANTPPAANGGRTDYAQQSAQYRAELDDHAHAMQDYHAAQARYAERIARWRARADACEGGDLDACNAPE